MKDVRIDGRLTRVFVLKESDDRLIYIPLKVLHRIDYDRLVSIENAVKGGGMSMLERMSEVKLDNGRNALTQYDSLIQVMNKTIIDGRLAGVRMRKPGEPEDLSQPAKEPVAAVNGVPVVNTDTQTTSGEIAPKPPRRKPGPKPKPKA